MDDEKKKQFRYEMSRWAQERQEFYRAKFWKVPFAHWKTVAKDNRRAWEIISQMAVVNVIDRLAQGDWRATELVAKLSRPRREEKKKEEKEKYDGTERQAYARVQEGLTD